MCDTYAGCRASGAIDYLYIVVADGGKVGCVVGCDDVRNLHQFAVFGTVESKGLRMDRCILTLDAIWVVCFQCGLDIHIIFLIDGKYYVLTVLNA